MHQNQASNAPVNEVTRLLQMVRPGVPFPVADVVIVPLLADLPFAADAAVLEDAIESGSASVSEVNEGGIVNLVQVENRGSRPLLLLDGEVVLGARQHRIFNATFVVAPEASDLIPVSCVEKSRWGYQPSSPHPSERQGERNEWRPRERSRNSNEEFTFSGLTFSGARRSRKVERVARSVTTTGRYDADQGEVWRDVDQYLERTRVHSRTSAFSDGYVAREEVVERALAGVAPEASQIGFAALHGTKLMTLDLFGSHDLYVRCWKKLMRGVLAEPLGSAPLAEDASAIVENALGLAANTGLHRKAGPGGGETLHGVREGCALGGASFNGVPYHVTLAL